MRASRLANRVALGVMVLAAGALSVAVLISAVPSLSYAQAGEDHLKCYLVKDSIKLKGKEKEPKYWLGLDPNQLGIEEDCKIVAVVRYFCVPVAKQVTAPVVSKDLSVKGSPWEDVVLDPVSGPAEGDKLCYKIKCDDPTVPATFDIKDQFGERQVETKKPFMLCGPAQKACTDWAAPMCNGFCPPLEVCQVNGAGTACECVPGGPTFNLDHYNVYPATGVDLIPAGVEVADQFFPFPGRLFESGLEPGWFMVPVSKDTDLPPDDPFTHLMCYPEAPIPGPDPNTVLVENQLGVDQLVTLTTTNSLCVPSVKEIAPGQINDNHYHCYNATGQNVNKSVNLRDQFNDPPGLNVTVEDPVLFCAPATKILPTGGQFPNSNTEDHLTCYNYDPIGVAPGPMGVSNQFDLVPDIQLITLLESQLLCVPSKKTWPVP